MHQHTGLKEKLSLMNITEIEQMYIDMMLYISRHKNTGKINKDMQAYMQDHRETTSFVHGYLTARLEALKS